MRLRDLIDGAAAPRFTADGALAEPLVVVDLDAGPEWHLTPLVGQELRSPHVPVIGISAQPLPAEAGAVIDFFDLTLAPDGPGRSWVRGGSEELARLTDSIKAHPHAAFTVAGLLRTTELLPVAQGLVAESLAYSVLLGGPEFAAWRRSRSRPHTRTHPGSSSAFSAAAPDAGPVAQPAPIPPTGLRVSSIHQLAVRPNSEPISSSDFEPTRARNSCSEHASQSSPAHNPIPRTSPAAHTLTAADPVTLTRDSDVLKIELNRPERSNAYSTAMRDGLLEALFLAETDPTIKVIELSGVGKNFCSGGDLGEFGTATDQVAAHAVRLQASAGLAISRLADRLRPRLHGACIGAGIELPSFADHVVARPDTWFQLPELRMGLLPGAGGTVSITHRIGRWRTAYLALSGAPIELSTALNWGLVDEQV